MATRREISLSNCEGGPSLSALCDDEGWNGFHVPLLTAETLAQHLQACASNDPDGTWADIRVHVVDGEVWMFADSEDCEPYVWPLEGAGAWIDGLTWEDAR